MTEAPAIRTYEAVPFGYTALSTDVIAAANAVSAASVSKEVPEK